MRVPTTDYTPLIRANQARTQSKRSQFIAPGIDYERESLKLRKKGIDLKLGEVTRQQNYNNLQLALGMGQLALKTVSTIRDYQVGEANKDIQQKISAWQAEAARRQATGELTVDENGNLVGLDGLNEFQEQQMRDIDSKKWFNSVKKDAKSALEGMYSMRENAIRESIYGDMIQKNLQVQQENLASYIDNDASRTEFITEGTPLPDGYDRSKIWNESNAYQLTDNYINSLPNITNESKQLLKEQAHKEIDLKRAQNSVRVAAQNRSLADALKVADQWADTKNYDEATRESLYGIAKRMSANQQASLQNTGLNTMATALQNGTMPEDVWREINERAEGLPEEQAKALKAGAEQAQLTYCMDIYSNLTQDVDTMLPGEVEQALEDLPGIKAQFEGTPATKAVYGQIRNAFQNKADEYARLTAKADAEAQRETERIQKEAEKEAEKAQRETERQAAEAQKAAHQDGKDLIAATLAVIEQTKNDFEGRGISGNAAMEQMQGVLLASKESLVDKPITTLEYINFEKAADKLIKGVSDEQIENKVYKEEISGCMKDIDTFLNERFGNGGDKKKPLAPEQEARILDAHNRAKGSLLDLAWDSKNLTSVEFAKRKNEIIAIFQMDNYDALTATPKSTNSRTQYEAAMEQTKRFEDNPQAVYYDERKGQFVWLDERLHSAYDNAARLEQEMLEQEYGIDIDYSKMPEYGKITGRRNEAGAELKELVPVFTSKDGDKYTVQGGKVYSYSEGAGVLVPKEILKQQNGKTKQKPEKKHNINNIMGGN